MTFYSRKRGLVSSFDSVDRVYCVSMTGHSGHCSPGQFVDKFRPYSLYYQEAGHLISWVTTTINLIAVYDTVLTLDSPLMLHMFEYLYGKNTRISSSQFCSLQF